MDNLKIQGFLDDHDYDIRKTHNGRWIDQKCTGVPPVARPSTQSGFMMTCAEMMFAALRDISA